ncbi:hypothetical protein Pelo_7519 [Pelomyxa schiedti]|nr:hypothetical protein Pelo_7519 [Pelomyxa schiedti]
MSVYVIRHGESEYNQAQTVGGHWSDPLIIDPKLTAHGVAQASSGKLHEFLQVLRPTIAVSSPLTRALQTAAYSLQLHTPPPLPTGRSADAAAEPTVTRNAVSRVIVTTLCAEPMYHSCNVGTLTSTLRRVFEPPVFDYGYMTKELWWYRGELADHCTCGGGIVDCGGDAASMASSTAAATTTTSSNTSTTDGAACSPIGLVFARRLLIEPDEDTDFRVRQFAQLLFHLATSPEILPEVLPQDRKIVAFAHQDFLHKVCGIWLPNCGWAQVSLERLRDLCA